MRLYFPIRQENPTEGRILFFNNILVTLFI
jgi:hypothetical protein